MVFFLNSKVKTHTEDALQYIFDENKEKIVILGYSIVSRRSPPGIESETRNRVPGLRIGKVICWRKASGITPRYLPNLLFEDAKMAFNLPHRRPGTL